MMLIQFSKMWKVPDRVLQNMSMTPSYRADSVPGTVLNNIFVIEYYGHFHLSSEGNVQVGATGDDRAGIENQDGVAPGSSFVIIAMQVYFSVLNICIPGKP